MMLHLTEAIDLIAEQQQGYISKLMDLDIKTLDISKIKPSVHSCSQCSLVSLCLPLGLNPEELLRLEENVKQSQTYKENQPLFRQNDKFKSIYAVRSGIFKSYSLDEKGHERILGFHLPGELIGLDAIYNQHYQYHVTALDTATVCSIPYDNLFELSKEIPSLQQQLLRLLSKEINHVNALTFDTSIDQRLAVFLLDLSKRFQQRGYSASHFNLAMPRQDIANYLHMAPETISRLFKRMQDKNIIKLSRRELIIEDMDALRELSGFECNH